MTDGAEVEQDGGGRVLDRSGLVNHSQRCSVNALPLLNTHNIQSRIHEHTHITPEAHFHTDSWAIDCGLYVLNCNMRSIKRGSQSHSVESSLATRLTRSPWCCLRVQNLPHFYSYSSVETGWETTAAQESIYTQKHETHVQYTQDMIQSHSVAIARVLLPIFTGEWALKRS